MSFSRVFSALGFVLVAAVSASASVGCSSAPAEKEDIGTYEGELRLASPRYLGQIANGETKTTFYSNPPRYRAYGFWAKGGDEITADVKSLYGDGMGWITTSSYDAVAANDDASSSTLDAKVVYKVPAGAASRAYRIVFRDYDHLDASFSVTLTIKSSAPPPPVTCDYNGSTYNEGDSFPSEDGCNDCSCSASGVACTKRACVCNPATETWRRYLGTPTTCQMIRYSCNADERSFSNSCGCGCEKLSR